MTKEKNLNLKEFKSLVKKLIKEEIQKTTKSAALKEAALMVADDETPAKPAVADSSVKDKIDALEAKIQKGYSKLIQFKGAVKEAKQKELEDWRKEAESLKGSLKESALVYKKKLVILEYRRTAIKNIILKEASFFDKLRGTVNPSAEVDDPKHIHNNIKSALNKANSIADKFNKNVLVTSTAINAYHEAVKETLEKMSLLNGASDQIVNEYRPKIIAVARAFFKNLRSEEDSLKAFKQSLVADAEKNGIDKSYLIKDLQAPTPKFKVKRPQEVAQDHADTSFVDKVINGAKGMAGAK